MELVWYNDNGDKMKIFIDADGCPVIEDTINIAKQYDLDVIIVKNYAHHIENDYATIITVDISRDSADFYIVNHSQNGDIIVTQDYGLAAMGLAKNSYIITQNGLIITNENIDKLLNQRHLNQEMRRKHKIYTHIKKRKASNTTAFKENITQLIEKALA